MLTITVNPTTNDLTDLTTAQRELQLDQDAMDGLAALISTASEMCAAYCGRLDDRQHLSEFGAQTVQQTERRVYRDCIILERNLNPAITSITEDGTALASTDYELDGALLYRLSDDTRTCWAAEKVVITYTTGWPLLGGMPRPIGQACLITLRALVEDRARDPRLRSERVEGVVALSYLDPSAEAAGLPQPAADLLRPWRRIHL